MAEKKQPWMKWYPSDWRSEPGLRMVSRAARSLWLDMLGIMHEADPYGELRLNGRALKVPGLAKLLGDRESDVFRWLSELEVAGVFSRKEDGTIFSRRMVRDAEKALKDKENGRKGGNPSVKGGVNPQVNGKDKAHIPEARDQKPDSYAREPGAILVSTHEVAILDRWHEIWNAFQGWGKLPETSTEHRARESCLRMACHLPSVDELIARIHAQGDRLRAGHGKRGGWAVAPHNWLERDRGWADAPPASNIRPIDADAARAAWDGAAAKLIDALGDKGLEKWAAWFASANFVPGPPARICVRKAFEKNQIERNFSGPLRRAFGDFEIQVAA